MELTQMDREMLPAWVTSSEKSLRCFQWLSGKADTVLELDAYTLYTSDRPPFYFLYCRKMGTAGAGKGVRPIGIFNTATYELTDAAPVLHRILELPDGLHFRNKACAERTVARNVNGRLLYCLEHRPELFYPFGRDIIPVVGRREIEEQAAVFFLDRTDWKDIRYIPSYCFGDAAGHFTAHVYLMYLQDGERLEQAVTRQWIRKFGAEMYRQKIIYGCVREELLAVERSPRHRLHKVFKIRETAMLAGDGSRVVTVRVRKGKQAGETRMLLETLKDCSGRYLPYRMDRREQRRMEALFWDGGKVPAEAVEKIYDKEKILFDAGWEKQKKERK